MNGSVLFKYLSLSVGAHLLLAGVIFGLWVPGMGSGPPADPWGAEVISVRLVGGDPPAPWTPPATGESVATPLQEEDTPARPEEATPQSLPPRYPPKLSGPPPASSTVPDAAPVEWVTGSRGAPLAVPDRSAAPEYGGVVINYTEMVRTRLDQAKRYPWRAMLRGMEGTVHLNFQIGFGGMAGEIRLARSSGWEVLDQEAVATVRRASPFPSIPPEYNNQRIEVQVPLIFRLN